MSFSSVDICNRALNILGVGTIISLTQENPQARACNASYDIVRDMALSEFAWGFASAQKKLNKLASDPLAEWDYAYSFPNGAIKIQKIYGGDLQQEGAPFQVGYGNVVYTDVDEAVALVTMRVEDAGSFPLHFVDLFSARLAIELAGTLQGISNRIDKAQSVYIEATRKAELAEAVQSKKKKDRTPLLDARRGVVDLWPTAEFEDYKW